MSNDYPLQGFRFQVDFKEQMLTNEAEGGDVVLCSGAFSECSGLELTMEPKSIREGGNNGRQHHFVGPVGYGQLTLKRGMTANFDLWRWFSRTMQKDGSGVRASGFVVMLAADGTTERLRFELEGCLPIKLRAPTLNAKEGAIAVEEMQIAYEVMRLKEPS